MKVMNNLYYRWELNYLRGISWIFQDKWVYINLRVFFSPHLCFVYGSIFINVNNKPHVVSCTIYNNRRDDSLLKTKRIIFGGIVI